MARDYHLKRDKQGTGKEREVVDKFVGLSGVLLT